MDVVADPRPDGRRLRSERNKEAVVLALLSLFDAGEIEPSAARVAEVAGVSERSVFRYFLDKDDLDLTAMTLQWERVKHLYDGLDDTGSFDERLTAILEHRLRLFDAVRGVMTASSVREHRSEVIRTASDLRRKILRKQVTRQFAPEIADRPHVARAADMALSLETLSYLADQYSRATLRHTVETTLRGILGGH